MNIRLGNNKGKAWHVVNESYIKGFAFIDNQRLSINNIYEKMIDAIDKGELDKLLLKMNGNFSVILKYDNSTYLIADKLKTMPLLYTKIKKEWLITDQANIILAAEDDFSFNEEAIMIYLSLGYLYGNQTLLNNCNIVTAGTYVELDGKAKIVEYHKHIYEKKVLNDEEIKEGCVRSLENSMKRMVASIGNRPIWIPLSGGYDSRLLACVCKKLNVKNVKCFTYGIPESNEVKISREVANKLGYPWYYVEYTKDKFLEIAESPMDDDYILWAMNLNTTSHYQDFLAFKELKDKGIIEDNAVIVPGHSGEILGRDQIPYHLLKNNNSISLLLFYRYFNWNPLKKRFKKTVLNLLNAYLNTQNSVTDRTNTIDLFSNWNIQNRQANFIVNAVRVYEYFGNDWRVPLWDDELSEFWFSLKWEKNSAVKLYNKFIFEEYFIPMGVPFYKKVNRATTFIASIRLPFNIKSNFKKVLSRLTLIKKHYDPNDINYRSNFYLKKMSDFSSPYIHLKKSDTNSTIALYQIYLLNKYIGKI